MPITSHQLRIPLILSALALTVLGCQISLGGPQPPDPPIDRAGSESPSLLEAWDEALSLDPNSGEISIVITEEQVTSYLAAQLDPEENPLVSDPQVFLRDGNLQVFGTAQRGPFVARVLVMVAPLLDEEGSIDFEVTSVDLGPLPAPEALRDTLSAVLTEAFTGTLGPLATGLHITSIYIADGQAAIAGRLR